MSVNQATASSQAHSDVHRHGKRIQDVIERAMAFPDLDGRALIQESLASVLEMYGEGLAHILELLKSGDTTSRQTYDAVVNDKFVGALLLVHGLHPVDLQSRLRTALDSITPYMESHGGNVEIVSIENEVAHLRLKGTCHGCPSSSITMELAIRRVVNEACPDLQGLEVEGVTQEPSPAQISLHDQQKNESAWIELQDNGEFMEGCAVIRIVAGISILIAKLKQTLYAYRNECPVCGKEFIGNALTSVYIGCPTGHRFDVQHAGSFPDDPTIHLDPFPLLVENGTVKIAV